VVSGAQALDECALLRHWPPTLPPENSIPQISLEDKSFVELRRKIESPKKSIIFYNQKGNLQEFRHR
jgi:hypothetical protein